LRLDFAPNIINFADPIFSVAQILKAMSVPAGYTGPEIEIIERDMKQE